MIGPSHLRLLPSPALQLTEDAACLEAFQRELDYVWRTLHRLGAPAADIEDLAQDMFLALRGAWAQYDQDRPLRPYLFGIAFRIVSAHQRKRGREIVTGVVEAGDSGPGPEDELESKQARALVLAALERIPLPRRAVLVMHDIDEVPVRSVATVLAIPLFTVYSRLRKARKELLAATRRFVKEANDP